MPDFFLPALDTVTNATTGKPMKVRTPGGQLAKGGPDGKGALTITLLGADSKALRDHSRESVRKRVAAGADQGDAESIMAAAEVDALDYLATATVEWSGFHSKDGKAVPCTPENAKALYGAFPTIRDQAEAFITDRRGFTNG